MGVFRSHTDTATGELAPLVVRYTFATLDDNPDITLGQVGLEMATWASVEKGWLRRYLPLDCYYLAWIQYSKAVDAVEWAADAAVDAEDRPRAEVTSTVQIALHELDRAVGEMIERSTPPRASDGRRSRLAQRLHPRALAIHCQPTERVLIRSVS